MQARLEHATLRFDVCTKLVHPSTYLRLELAKPQIVPGDQLVLPTLELLGDIRDPVLEPLRTRIPDVRQPFREDCLRFSGEGAHGPLQLTCEALRRILSRGLHKLSEPLRSLVSVRRDRAIDRTLELLDLPAGEIVEAAPHALHRVGLLSLCLLQQLSFTAGHSTLELVESSATVGRVRFQLVPHDAQGVVEGASELRAQSCDSGTLLLALGRQPLGVRGEPELDLAEHLLLSLLELGDPRFRRLGDAVEIL